MNQPHSLENNNIQSVPQTIPPKEAEAVCTIPIPKRRHTIPSMSRPFSRRQTSNLTLNLKGQSHSCIGQLTAISSLSNSSSRSRRLHLLGLGLGLGRLRLDSLRLTRHHRRSHARRNLRARGYRTRYSSRASTSTRSGRSTSSPPRPIGRARRTCRACCWPNVGASATLAPECLQWCC